MRRSYFFQQGSTLISLLIGMLISLLCIGGSLTLYKNLVRVAAETQSDATYDGQIALSMLTARLELQNAGFGIAGPGTTHIATQTSGSSNSLYWRYKIGNQFYCKGIRDIAVNGNRELRLIEASTNTCTETAALTSLSYSTTQTLGEFKNSANAVVSFTVSQQSCWPYGVGKVAPHYQVVISANTAAKQFNSAVNASTYTYCLPNIYPT
jgi:Tfp pilus assembly protein PilW